MKQKTPANSPKAFGPKCRDAGGTAAAIGKRADEPAPGKARPPLGVAFALPDAVQST